MIKQIENNEFYEIIKNKRVLIDFYATWCGPCKMLGLVLEKISKENLIDIYKVDVDIFSDLASEYNIYSVPTLIVFEDGKEVKRISGFMNEEELKKWVI